MSAWRKIAFACFVCSPAMLVVGGLAAAVETELGSLALPRVGNEIQVAEDAPAPEAAPPTEEAAAAGEETEDEGPAVFTEEFMNDPANIEAGKVVWETCGGCHGSRAYPGKAPKLRPKKYTPEFTFDRVTNGYKKMPAWKDVFTKEERMAVVTWVLSDDFAP